MFHLNAKATHITYEGLWLVNAVLEPAVNAFKISHDDIMNANSGIFVLFRPLSDTNINPLIPNDL
jgi:hypothetical protein